MKRIFGLDVMRSLAIIIVVISHSSFLIQSYSAFPYIPLPDGVDLFFVLSGYLVGGLLIKQVKENGALTLGQLLHFLKRRWLRTLPNYYLFLLINIVLIFYGLIPGTINKYLITYFLFLQNFFKPFDFLYWESWSLSVEEWFYLFLPVLLFVILKINIALSIKNSFWFAVLVLIILPFIYRLFIANATLDNDLFFRKLVITRLDTIGFGVLAAFIHSYYPEFWFKFRNSFFLIGLVVLAALIAIQPKQIFFYQTFYFSLSGLSIALLLPKLESWKEEPFQLKPFQFMSKISYSLYLVHLPLLFLLSGFFNPKSAFLAIATYLIFWITSIILAYLIYRYFELPFMNLRNRLKAPNH